MSRSFTGCKRCKTRRQKCDEAKPVCGRCRAAKAQCRYTVQLQWGGRSFSRSRLGACMGNGRMQKLEYSPGEFIYTVPGSTSTCTSPSQSQSQRRVPETETPTLASRPSPTSLSLTRPVDPFSPLSSEQRGLLHHFINDASQITACHVGMQRGICKMLIPMALETPSLLYATAALSAIHLQALKNNSESVKSAPDIARLMAAGLEHFRNELRDPGAVESDALLATARTLCLAEIHSGAVHPKTWRAHVEGAKALMATCDDAGAGMAAPPALSSRPFRKYLNRWYKSIVSLTALTADGPPDEFSSRFAVDQHSDTFSPDYLDDYWGFTVQLSDIFSQIGAVAWRRRQNESNINVTTSMKNDIDTVNLMELDIQHQAASLETSVQHMMARDASSQQPTFYPGVIEGLTPSCIHEFTLCNKAYQHSALIQIHRRLRRTPTTSTAVQASVKKILEYTSLITPSPGLSPWVMLTTPLFIAGCEARGSDRELVRRLLCSLHDTIRIPNVLQSLRFLEGYWVNRAGEDEDWCRYLDRMQVDFIPY